jgi:hypothetical protein
MARNAVQAGRSVAARGTAEPTDAGIASSRALGALATIAGALVMIGGVFLPWLSYPGGEKLSGWSLYQHHVNSGGNGFVITRVFSERATSVLFTGFTMLIAGIVVALAALWVLGLSRRDRLGVHRLGGHVTLPAMQLANLTMGLGIINLVMVLTGGSEPVKPGLGLYVLIAGGLVLCLGMFTAVRTRRS